MSSTLLLIGILFITLYVYFKWSYQYWKRKNVITPEASFPFGNFSNSFTGKYGMFQIIAENYHKYKTEGHKFVGLSLLTKPVFVPIDLDLIKLIMVKDHQNFMDRGMFYNEKDDPLSAHLFSIEGKKWQALRGKLSPTFTSGKMKMMFPTLLDVGVTMKNYVMKMVDDKEPLDVKEILAKYSTDIIGSCAFGIECNSFVNPNSEFRKYGNLIFSNTLPKLLKGFVAFLSPSFARKIHICLNTSDLSSFFMRIVKDTVKYREENNIDRNDFMKLLIELKNGSSELGKLTIEEIAAQAFIFFAAGFETSSTTMTFCLYELSKNQDIQDKLRQEINAVIKKYDNKITYDSLKEMKLLQCVIDETLRMYPPVPMLNRVVTKTYKIPDSDLTLENGLFVFIPVYGIHYDPEFYPNPDKFDPSRFSEENKANINQFAHLPFGEGPRNCVGLRFGLMQTKVGLVNILKDLRITLNEKTKTPLEIDPVVFTLTTTHKIYLDAQKV